ncbi:interleukin-15 receptor subunit alpha isoform X2 [Hyla sarda]|uniref:interleukin-15 receptor subunit alpha isoform X2 n=1 Tax=Hyla sarda TaxID=327740 RepID=UPI0024C38627|nr:interleukin-15 receptor subunit alpha isoform X2 [Hyla sarda]XP_056425315.1 interleukin-15 receptor subunit alpha isoform X2 [Hyla sarda]
MSCTTMIERKENSVCGDPKTVKNTEINPSSKPYRLYSHMRYKCEDGYKRQAGTSNIAICKFDNKTQKAVWKYGNISCIRDPSIPIITPSSTQFPVSSSSHVSTSSSTTVETFNMLSSTPTVRIHEKPHTIQEKVTQTTQLPAHTPGIWLSTTNDSTAPGRTRSPGLQFSTQTILPKETRRATTEQEEYTGYTVTVKQSTVTNFITSVQDINYSATEPSTWQKHETVTIATGTLVTIISLVVVIVLVVCCNRRRQQTPPRNPEDIQMYVQATNPTDNFPGSGTPAGEEETFL